ncbi:nuclear transport factor 2 family protein [bacterium]|nr:nuclear transport factor 2 family protein [bacterium]
MDMSGSNAFARRVGGIVGVPFVLMLCLGAGTYDGDSEKCGSDRHSGRHASGHREMQRDEHQRSATTWQSSYSEDSVVDMQSFPGLGNTYALDLGDGQGDTIVVFDSPSMMRFQQHYSSSPALRQVAYTALPINDEIYLVAWKDGDGVSRVASFDFATGGVATLIADGDGKWRRHYGWVCPATDINYSASYSRTNDDWDVSNRPPDYMREDDWNVGSGSGSSLSANMNGRSGDSTVIYDSNYQLEGDVTSLPPAQQLQANKQAVRDFFNMAFVQRDPAMAAERYLGTSFRHHMPGAPAGEAGFVSWANSFNAAYPETDVTVKNIVAEGDTVMLYSEVRHGPNGPTHESVDIFRMEDGRIAEHWGVKQEAGSASGYGSGFNNSGNNNMN